MHVDQVVEELAADTQDRPARREIVGVHLELVDVTAGTEGAAGAGEHDRTSVTVAPNVAQRIDQPIVHLIAERVHAVWPIQRHNAHGAVIFDKNGSQRGRLLDLRHDTPIRSGSPLIIYLFILYLIDNQQAAAGSGLPARRS